MKSTKKERKAVGFLFSNVIAIQVAATRGSFHIYRLFCQAAGYNQVLKKNSV